MNINEFIKWCVDKSISFSLVDNDQLKVNSAPGALTPEIVEQLKERKSDIVGWLKVQMASRILPRPRSDKKLNLSFSQQRLWLLDQIEGGSANYNMPSAMTLTGRLNQDALNQAFTSIFERHESLRTCFSVAEDEQPVQIIQEPVDIVIPVTDLSMLEESQRQSSLSEILDREVNYIFNLSADLMLRAHLVKLKDDEHALLVNMHHIASDGWSLSILINEFSALYGAYAKGQPNPLEPLTIQYGDYAHWQRNWLQGDILEQQLDYWIQQLSDLPVIHGLPTDYPRPTEKTYEGKVYVSQIDAAGSSKLKEICQKEGCSLFMGLHAAFSALIARYSNQTDIVIGSPIANREQAEISGLIGFFVNTLVLRSDLSTNPSFIDLLRQSKSTLLDAYAHQQVPFEQIVERLQPERSLGYSSLFQIMLVLQNNEQGELELPDLTLKPLALNQDVAKYDIRLDITDTDEGLLLQWEYSTDLFEERSIAGMAVSLDRLLGSLTEFPNESIFSTDILDSAERRKQLMGWNDTTADFPSDKCIHELFEQQVENNPDAVAVVFEDASLTYGELNQQANQVAHYLLDDLQITPDTLVGICMERSLEMVTGILAVLKAGGAYVPLDPDYPVARLMYMLDDAQPLCILAQSRVYEVMSESSADILCLDSDVFKEKISNYPINNPSPSQLGLTNSNIAYVIYTSGSTGNPKGVMVEHKAVANRIHWMGQQYGASSDDRILQKTPFSFDVSVWEFMWPLSAGARIVLAKPGGHKDPMYLSTLIQSQEITKLHFVPSMLNNMLSVGDLPHCTSIRQVFCSGEALAIDHVNKFLTGCPWAELHNLYGPTEAAIDVSYWDCSQLTAEFTSVPIGRPISNTQLLVLSKELLPVPQGVAGELHIGGVGLARGYLNRPDLTREKFIANPFFGENAPGHSSRLYKTGDLVRRLPDGNLEFLGRIDHQVKVRGFRIELGEIENTLISHKQVQDSVVLAKETENGDTKLLAFVVPHELNEKTEYVVDVNATAQVFDDMYKSSPPDEQLDPYSNFAGWISSYNGKPIPQNEMEFWRGSIVENVLAVKPKRVLEIGVGSGLLLWKIAPHCEEYWGTEISVSSLKSLQEAVNQHPRLVEKVKLRHQEAIDFSGIPEGFFDTIIINSVVQYFPDVDYLHSVLSSAVKIASSDASIFVGDIRNLELLATFQTAVQTLRAQDEQPLEVIKGRINTAVQREEELLLDPEFFDAFSQKENRVSGVDLQIKKHAGENELTQYRYDVILRVEAPATVSARSFKSIEWGQIISGLDTLQQTLSEDRPEGLRVRNVPNVRIESHNHLYKRLNTAANLAELKELLEGGTQSKIDVSAFSECAQAAGYVLHATWASKGNSELLDMVFVRRDISLNSSLVDIYDSSLVEDSQLCDYANNPRLGALHVKLINSLREYVNQKLPDYMEPSSFVILDTLPLTPNGKVDRKELMASGVENLQTTYIAPRTETEKLLCETWQRVLGVARVGILDNFFQLGGNSLSATRVIAHISEALKVQVPLKDMFSTQTLEALALVVDTLDVDDARPALGRVSRDQALPASYAQQRLWLLDQIDQGSAHYNMPSSLKLTGALDAQAVHQAFRSVIERHESLRTCFKSNGDAEPIQIIQSADDFSVRMSDLSGLQSGERQLQLIKLMAEETGQVFDLSRDLMLRARLIKLSEQEHIVLVTLHHIASDGWSMPILINEFSKLYSAYSQGQGNPLKPLDIQYADYAYWQRNWLKEEVLDQQLAYWEAQLANLPVVHGLPLDYPRPAIQTYAGDIYVSQLNTKVSKTLNQLCNTHGATIFMALHAAFSVLLARYSNETDIVTGSPIANREQPEVADLIGFFVNTLVVRTDLSGDPTFVELLRQSKETLMGAYAHQQVPFEQIVERLQPERSLSHSPLFQVMLVLQNNEQGTLELPGLTLSPVEQQGASIAKYDLTLSVTESTEGLRLGWEYNTDLFEQGTIARMAQHFDVLIRALLAEPEKSVFDTEMLSVQERDQLLSEWNDTQKAFASEKCIHELFESVARSQPNAIAVTFEEQQLTYKELNQRANQLAHYLMDKKQVKPDTRVGICIERSLEMVVSILAVLKAGGGYVPLDPDYPQARLLYMLEDAQLSTILTKKSVLTSLPFLREHGVFLDDDEFADHLQSYPCTDPHGQGLTSDHLAYVIYTSGSTGNPKGVMVEHQALFNRIDWMHRQYGCDTNDQILQKTPFSFDVSVWEFLWPLTVGAGLVLAKPEGHKDPDYLTKLIRDRKVTKLHFVPSMLSSMLAFDYFSHCESLRQVFCSGEALSLHQVEQFRAICPWAELHNLYGPTEAAIDVSYWDCSKSHAGFNSVPIGQPIQNIKLIVLDKHLNPVPVNVAGELHIGGVGLARGYLNRPELTAEKFIQIPPGIEEIIEGRLYKTGDLVRWLPNGNLEFLGRIDHQVKIRGFRIELGEIESNIDRLNDVKESIVIAKEDAVTGDRRLQAYVVTNDAQEGNARTITESREIIENLRSQLRQMMPDYMVPSAFVLLDSLPLTTNGKVDRKALPEPESSVQQATYVAPKTEMEILVCNIWEEVLGTDRVGIEDNFFHLGGHSLLAVKLAANLERAFSKSVPLRTILGSPTVTEQVKFLKENVSEATVFKNVTPDLENLNTPFPLTDVQQAYWIGRGAEFELGNVSTHIYSEIPIYNADARALQNAINRLIERHATLRLVVNPDGQQQILESVPEYNLVCYDLTRDSVEDAERGLLDIRDELSHQVLSTDSWPLFDFRLSQLSGQRAVLHISMEVLIVDGSSMNILARECASLYMNPERPLLPITFTFRDYVLAERSLLASPVYEHSKNYWLERLNDFPSRPSLPLAVDPAHIESPRFERREHILDSTKWSRLKQIAQSHHLTPTALLLGCMGEVLNKWSDHAHFALNLTLFNRIPFHSEVNDILGDFTSLTLLEMDYRNSATTFIERLKTVQNQLWTDLEHRYFSGVAMQRALRNEKGNATNFPVVFTSVLGLNEIDDTAQQPDELYEAGEIGSDVETDELMKPYSLSQTSQVWLDIQVFDVGKGLGCNWDSVEGLFPDGLLDDMFTAVWQLLDKLCSGDTYWYEQNVLEVDSTTRQLIDKTNEDRLPISPDLLHAPLWEQIGTQGEKVAVRSSDKQLSYQSLGELSQRLASNLIKGGAESNKLIAVVMDKGWEQVVAVLGILTSGAAYLPIDATQPKGRIQRLLELGQVGQVVTTEAHRSLIPNNLGVHIVDDNMSLAEGEHIPVRAQSNPSDIAYVIFTSGSTGEPKGVTISHEAALNTILTVNERYAISENDNVFGLSNLNFDLSVFDIFGVLGAGGTLVLPTSEEYRNPAAWIPYLVSATDSTQGVTVWNTVPALMQLLIEECERRSINLPLRMVMMSGDWIPVDLPERIRAVAPSAQQMSLGGATEVSVWSIHYPICEVDPAWKSIPYGRALPNQQIYVLKNDLSFAPVWVTGDIYIGGVGLALGYWQDSEKTKDSFIIHPQSGERLYRTGDQGRLLPDGNIEFRGRLDSQVKIGGYRIELGEIEARLNNHSLVKDAVAATYQSQHGQHLVAYVTGYSIDSDLTESHLSAEEKLTFKMSQNGIRKLEGTTLNLPLLQADRLPVSMKLSPSGEVDVDAEISLEEIGKLCQNFYRQSISERPFPKAFYPSGGTLYPVQVYLCIRKSSDSVPSGYYYYNPLDHQLIRVGNAENIEADSSMPLQLILVADFAAIQPLYGDLSNTLCQTEAGYMAQLIESSLTSSIALTRLEHGASYAVNDALKLNDSHRLLQIFEGGISSRALAPGADLVLTHANRKSYRSYTGSPDLDDLYQCLSVLKHRQTDRTSLCSYYVYLRRECVCESGAVLAPGAYRYDAVEGSLRLLVPEASELLSIGENILIEAGSSFVVLMVAQDDCDINDALFESGFNGQALSHCGMALDIGFCAIGNVNQKVARRALQLAEEESVIHALIGGRIDSKQMETLDEEKTPVNVEKILNDYVREALPEYMVPGFYVFLDEIPLTANGKVDRKSLPEPDTSSLEMVYVAPSNQVEEILCDMWQKILGVDGIGVNDNFFRIGGNSLLAIRMVGEIRERFIADEIDVSLRFVFENPSIKEIADLVSMKARERQLKRNEKDLLECQDSELEQGIL